MKFIALEQEVPGTTEEQFRPHLRAEAFRAWELTQAGVFREIYFRADADAAVIVLECATTEEAQAALGSLPLVVHGLIRFEVIPLKPYSGFARLFR